MIVKLVKPQDVGAPCLLFEEQGIAGFVKATADVLAMIDGRSGYFEAKQDNGAWRFEGKVADQRW